MGTEKNLDDKEEETPAERKFDSNTSEESSLRQYFLSIAQIHSSILAIIMAILAISYGQYIYALKEKEEDVFNNALRVNKLNFAVSCVFPSQEFSYPKDVNDSVKLAKRLSHLADCVGYKNPNEIVIAEDIVDRARSIFAIINVVSGTSRVPN